MAPTCGRSSRPSPRATPACWTFAVDGLIGSSPETLVSVDHSAVTARVLAGSAARGVDAASDQEAAAALASSTKDQDEHEYAVQSVLAALAGHSARRDRKRGAVHAQAPEPVAPGQRHRGRAHRRIDLPRPRSRRCTPPRRSRERRPRAALAVIDELEPFDRGRYAGPVGWVGADGDGEWAIALRCAQVAADGTVTAHAGAGIVADSVPEHELVETRMKFRPIIEAFG